MYNTPITQISLDGRAFYVKRDDLADPYLAGNKFRKLHALLQTPPQKLDKIISYGGTQSNAMLAIAAMCNRKNWHFTYYTKPLSDTQKNENFGNFFHAKKLGMEHVEIEEPYYKDFVASVRLRMDERVFVVDQGGAVEEARLGLDVLAKEIKESALDVTSLATPSGTGTTALFLALSLPECKVYTTPCVGNSEYLKKQMCALHPLPQNLIILEPKKKYHFAKPYKEFLEIQQKLLSEGVEFDLIYAPSMWMALLEQTQEEVLYIHSGGVSGNESMLARYRQKGFI